MNDLSDMLIKHRIVSEQAIYDPQGFDGGRTLDAMNCIQTIISERERNYRAEIERLEAALATINGPDDTGDDSMFNVRRLRAELARAKAALAEKEKECQRYRAALTAVKDLESDPNLVWEDVLQCVVSALENKEGA